MTKKILTIIVILAFAMKLCFSQTTTTKFFQTEPQKTYLEKYLKEYRLTPNVTNDKILASINLEDFLFYNPIKNDPQREKYFLTGIIEIKDTNDLYEIVLNFETIEREDYQKQIYNCTLNGKINNTAETFEGKFILKDIKLNKSNMYGGNYYLCTYDYKFNSVDKINNSIPKRKLNGIFTIALRPNYKALNCEMVEGADGQYSDINRTFVGTLTKSEENKQFISKTVFGDDFYSPIRDLPLVNFNPLFEDYDKPSQLMKTRFTNIMEYYKNE